MNIFQYIPCVMFIENEKDVWFANYLNVEQTFIFFNAYNNLKVDAKNLKIGDFLIKQSNIYVVKPLDTFDTISKKLNISKETLFEKIGTSNLFIGQKIEL